MNRERNVGIELLRIISMIMVLGLHYNIKGLYSASHNNTVNAESWIMICLSVVAVNCYVIISGYFMVEKSFNLVRIANIYIQVWFYSVFSYVIMMVLGNISFSMGGLFRAVTPFIHNSYWFVNCYILLLLFIPLINQALENISKEKLKLIIFTLVSTYSVFNNLVKLINPIDQSGGYSVVWFIVLYLSAAYIRKYYKTENKPMKYFFIYLLTVMINFLFHTLFGHLGEVWDNAMVRDYNNVLVYVGAICLFLTCLNLNINAKGEKKIICFLGPLTFAVYLLHESPFVWPALWNTINVYAWNIGNIFFIIQAFLTVIVIFGICCLIEAIRKGIFKLLKVDRLVSILSKFIETKVRKKVTKG